MVRCINIDWLEVFCREPVDAYRDASYFIGKGYFVESRDYGTRVYKEMFTVYQWGMPFVEVRRNPLSQGAKGIYDGNECHLRLVNRACYYNNASSLLQEFLRLHGYADIRIKRIDLALDFSTFDSGDKPAAFIRRYFEHKYAKINQGNIRAFGKDAWNGQIWNSVSWGSPASQIFTKFYNKTMELYNASKGCFRKPYILFAWMNAGLIDNIHTCTLQGELVDVWRVEFTIQSPKANWMAIEIDGKAKNYQSLPNRLETYATKAQQFLIWASLAKHYFRFKYFQDGQRKDRCPDKVLFKFQEVETFYKIYIDKYTLSEKSTETDKWTELVRLLFDFNEEHPSFEVKTASQRIIADIDYYRTVKLLVNPWNKEELRQFEEFLDSELYRQSQLGEIDMREIKKSMRIKKRTFNDF